MCVLYCVHFGRLDNKASVRCFNPVTDVSLVQNVEKLNSLFSYRFISFLLKAKKKWSENEINVLSGGPFFIFSDLCIAKHLKI